MEPRFFTPDLQHDSTAIALPADEAEHLTRVLRLGPGAEVRVFDGRGTERRGVVTSVVRGDVRVEIHGAVSPAAEPRVRITIAQAVLKGDKMDDLIRDTAMLGVAAICPLLTARTDVPESAFATSRRIDRWRRIAVSSVKQCGRAVVPDLAPPESVPKYLQRDHAGLLRLMFIEPGGAGDRTVSGEALTSLPKPDQAHVLLGPEGGWAPEEVTMAIDAGCVPVTLGQRIWRADVAPIIALSVLQYLWGDL